MAGGERHVLHVFPHPGGGGETYADVLAEMPGYRFSRVSLAPHLHAEHALGTVLRRTLGVNRRAGDFDLVHAHGEVVAALCLPALARRPSVITLHGLNLVRRTTGTARRTASVNLQLVMRAADRTVCVSRAEHAEVVAAVDPRAAKKAVCVPNGLPIPASADGAERASTRAELGIPDSVAVGLWVGALDEPKDPQPPLRAALETVARGVAMTLLVAGDGPLRLQVERAARNARRGAIHVLGFRRDVRRLLAAADFFVLSSHREGLSYSLLEAMAAGLPPIVTDVPGNAEAVGDAGILVPVGDVGAFGVAYARLATDPAERQRLGGAARERVERRFSADEMIERTREVYDAAHEGHGRG